MMPFSPYFGYPYYRTPLSRSHNFNNQKLYNLKKEPIPRDCSDNNTDSYDYEQFINIFGFKLHFDDLLILALLFFLYKEEVKDESLYIALILLLLT